MTRAALAVLTAAGTLAAVPAAAQAATPSPEGGPGAARTVEKGYAVNCSGRSGDVFVAVDLYQNSAYGTHTGVVVETPEGEYGGGYGPGDTTLFSGGAITADIPVRRLDETGEPAGGATVTGTYTTAGEPTRVREVVEDPPGHYVITRGTNTPLTASVTVEVLGRTVPLSCSTAFAFDLTVVRVTTGRG
ncbi:hypothetical protein [Streptomyces pini]|uniref:Secreted protein n=1 Tax=Streptomyces pini TaxID=1520580 RepID=A0A1I4DB75_9ACTN|nr:hypothetical protein [Streptomyces pini]SFK90878.1 hypothetical protein SAMN05192584_11043 [Streptomyces pini]